MLSHLFGGLGVGLIGGVTSGLLGVSPGGGLVVFSVLLLGVEQHVAQGISLIAQIPPTSISGVRRYRVSGVRSSTGVAGVVGHRFRDRRHVGSAGGRKGFGRGPAMDLRCLFVRAGRGDDFPAPAPPARREIGEQVWPGLLARHARRRRSRRIFVWLHGNWWWACNNGRSHSGARHPPASGPTGQPNPGTCPDDGSCRVGLLAAGLVRLVVCSGRRDFGTLGRHRSWRTVGEPDE